MIRLVPDLWRRLEGRAAAKNQDLVLRQTAWEDTPICPNLVEWDQEDAQRPAQ